MSGGAWKVEMVLPEFFRPGGGFLKPCWIPKLFSRRRFMAEKSPSGKGVFLAPTTRTLSGYAPSFWSRLSATLAGWFQSDTTLDGSRPSPCQAQFTVMADKGGIPGFRRKLRARLARLGGWDPGGHFPGGRPFRMAVALDGAGEQLGWNSVMNPRLSAWDSS